MRPFVVLARGIWSLVEAVLARRPDEPGFRFVFVNDDGSVRELDADERAYLDADHHPADGGRPYVKLRYASRTPDGRLGGYLERRRVPPRISIEPHPVRPG